MKLMAIKVIHVEGGLGNQMACYAVYMAAKEGNPGDLFYIDTYLYDVKEAHATISMWNGYELEKVFGVKIPDIRSLFSDEQVAEQIEYLRKSEFWKHDWNYCEVFKKMMKTYGIIFEDEVVETNKSLKSKIKNIAKSVFRVSSKNRFMYTVKRFGYKVYNSRKNDSAAQMLQRFEGNKVYDISLDFMKSPYLNKVLGTQMRENLQFTIPEDEANKEMLNRVRNCNSISVHVRRTDFLKFNVDCYKYGYFVKAVQYIKSKVKNPVFFVFSDDLKWCEDNISEIGLSKNDKIYFVGINSGSNSFRDMQIMANCKHNIATKSSFGWWGSFLNPNPNKITITQVSNYVSTKQF